MTEPAPDDAAVAGRSPWLTLFGASLSITLGALPVFLLGALAVFIRDELDFSPAALGAVASLYYLSSALASSPGGRLAERLGGGRAIAVAATGTVIATLGIALVATSWSRLAFFMVVAGIGNGIAFPSSNLALARGIPAARLGMAFGFKQSSGPIAALLAGIAVPLLGLTVGWRWAFLLAAAAGIPLIIAGLRARVPAGSTKHVTAEVPTAPLVVLAFGAAGVVVAGSSLGAFYVESAVSHDIPTGVAGLLLAAGSLIGIVARVGWGWVADRSKIDHFHIVIGLLVLGSLGLVMLGMVSSMAGLVVVTVLVFATAWAWPGVFNFAVVSRLPHAPAMATGITGTGQFAGGIIGPLGFGLLVQHRSYTAAWLFAAISVFLAAGFMYVGSRMLSAAIRPDAGIETSPNGRVGTDVSSAPDG